jgi:uncharacterized protein
MKQALIFYGGWEGHRPKEMAELLAEQLHRNDFDVTLSDTLDALSNMDLMALDLIVPNWSMGTISKEQLTPLLEAVKQGVGLAGNHGGMGDAFRTETEYQFMVGGQWVAHPGNDGVTYKVYIEPTSSQLTEGLDDFTVTSEQYYMHVDPGNTVLATTHFGTVVMPVVWTKHYGKGRVFYLSLGHTPEILHAYEPLTLMTRGMLWGAESKANA